MNSNDCRNRLNRNIIAINYPINRRLLPNEVSKVFTVVSVRKKKKILRKTQLETQTQVVNELIVIRKVVIIIIIIIRKVVITIQIWKVVITSSLYPLIHIRMVEIRIKMVFLPIPIKYRILLNFLT